MKKLLTILSLILITFTISACKPKVDEDNQAVLDKAWEKLADKNAEYETGQINFEGTGSIEMGDDKGDIEGSGELLFDSSDPSDSKSALKAELSAEGSFEGKAGKIDIKGEIRTLGKNLYINIDNFVLSTGDPQIDLMGNLIGNLYKSQWISVPKPEGSNFETEQFKGKDVAAIAKKHNFFKIKEVLGYRNYQLEVNVEELKSYLKEVSALNDTTISDEELNSIDQMLALLDYSLEVTIDEDYELEEIAGNATIADPRTAGQTVEIAFSGSLGDKKANGSIDLKINSEEVSHLTLDFKTTHDNRSVDISVPEGAQEFDPGALFGLDSGGIGGLGGNPFGGNIPNLPEGIPFDALP